MRRITYPYTLKREVLKLYSEGVTPKVLIDRYNVNRSSLNLWAKQTGIKRGSNLTDEQLEAAMVEYARKFEHLEVKEGGDQAKRKASQKRKNLHKLGPTPEYKAGALATFEKLGDPEEYTQAISEHFDQVTEQLSYDNTLAEQVKSLSTGLLLVQLKQLIDCPPPMVTWTDAERVIKLLRLTLNMDGEKASKAARIDLTILNGKVEKKGKVIDAVDVTRKRRVS